MVLGLAAEPLHRWLGHVTHRPRLSERGGLEMLTSRIQARNLTESNGARLAGAVSCVRDNVVSSRPDLRCPPAIPAIGGGGMGDRSAYKSPPPARRARLYDARLHERDACGIGFVADLHGRPSRAMVERALCGLERLRHRGAVAADARTGDGAGLLLPIDQEFYAAPGGGNGRLGLAVAFLPADREQAKAAMVAIERALAAEGLELERWRTVPVDPEALGDQARASMPAIEQAVFRAPGAVPSPTRTPPAPRCTWRPARPEPSPTKRSAPPTSLPPSTPTWPTSACEPRSPSSTSATRPTPRPRGSARSRSGSSATTARSTPSRATAPGCGRVRGASAPPRWPARTEPTRRSCCGRCSTPADPTRRCSTTPLSCWSAAAATFATRWPCWCRPRSSTTRMQATSC